MSMTSPKSDFVTAPQHQFSETRWKLHYKSMDCVVLSNFQNPVPGQPTINSKKNMFIFEELREKIGLGWAGLSQYKIITYLTFSAFISSTCISGNKKV